MGRNHIKTLLGYDMIKTLYIYDSNKESLSLFLEKMNVMVINDLQLIMNLQLDYAVISTPTSSHFQIAQFLQAHVPVILVEKPLATSGEEARRFIDISENFGTIFVVGHVERFNPSVLRAKKTLEDGELGEVISIHTVRQGPRPKRIRDSGVILELASHDVDLVRYLCNSEYRKVENQSKSILNNKNEDFLVASGLLENDVIFTHHINWISPIKERKIQIYGTLGSLEIDMLQMEVTFNAVGTHEILFSELSHLQGNYQGGRHNLTFEKFEPIWREHVRIQNMICEIEDQTIYATVYDGFKTNEILDKMLHEA